MTKNRHGLSRYIGADVRRQIRRNSRFGCVLCRSAVYEYEHIDPEWSDAHEHDPDNMCLLCGGCHSKVSKKRISKQTVAEAYAEIQHSDSVERPFEELALFNTRLLVRLGTAIFESPQCLIRVDGTELLTITPPEDGAAFPTLNGIFCDSDGAEIFRINENIWEGPLNAWDIVIEGRRATIKTGQGEVALEFIVNPPSELHITQLNMVFSGCHIVCDENNLYVGRISEGHATYIGIGQLRAVGAQVAIDVDTSQSEFVYRGLTIEGGRGIELNGTGICVGVGTPAMTVGGIQIWEAKQ